MTTNTEQPSITTHSLQVALDKKERTKKTIIKNYDAALTEVNGEIAELQKSILAHKEREVAELREKMSNG